MTLLALVRELERLRVGIQAALDALADGDQWAACDILLALLEERPTAALERLMRDAA